jgi:hypothetical protein
MASGEANFQKFRRYASPSSVLTTSSSEFAAGTSIEFRTWEVNHFLLKINEAGCEEMITAAGLPVLVAPDRNVMVTVPIAAMRAQIDAKHAAAVNRTTNALAAVMNPRDRAKEFRHHDDVHETDLLTLDTTHTLKLNSDFNQAEQRYKDDKRRRDDLINKCVGIFYETVKLGALHLIEAQLRAKDCYGAYTSLVNYYGGRPALSSHAETTHMLLEMKWDFENVSLEQLFAHVDIVSAGLTANGMLINDPFKMTVLKLAIERATCDFDNEFNRIDSLALTLQAAKVCLIERRDKLRSKVEHAQWAMTTTNTVGKGDTQARTKKDRREQDKTLPAFKGTCNKCGEYGHKAIDCCCKHCKKTNHISSDCRYHPDKLAAKQGTKAGDPVPLVSALKTSRPNGARQSKKKNVKV